jgi:hypothetical protein
MCVVRESTAVSPDNNRKKYDAEHNMLGLNTDPTEGSQEFREILWTLVQEKERDSFVPSSARIWIERLLLVLGFALPVIYGAARLDSFFGSQAALNRFSAICLIVNFDQ